MDEYRFHIEEDFSLEMLSLGIEKVLHNNEMTSKVEVLNDTKCIISSTNMRSNGSKVFHKISGTVFSLSIYLEIEEDTLKVLFSDQSWSDKGFAFLCSIGVPILAFTAGYGAIRQNVVENEILGYIKSVLLDEAVSFSNMNLKQRIMCATPLISLVIFLTMGFVWNMWGWGSLAFLLIPIMPILLGEVNPEFIYPFVVTGIYVGLGFGLTLWHPAWIIFITIPIYYILFPIKKNKIQMKKKYTY